MATQWLTLAASVRIHGNGDYRGDADDPPALADLQVGGVEPEIWPVAGGGRGQELADTVVDILAGLGDGAL